MKIKLKRASAVFCLTLSSLCLLLASLCSAVSNIELASRLNTSEIQLNQDGRAVSSKSGTTPSGRLDSSLSRKKNSETSRDSFVARNQAPKQRADSCRLSQEVLDQIPKRSGPEWIVDDAVVKLLHNDLQELIRCTLPQEKVIFKLQEPVALRKTMRITHELEFIGESVSVTGGRETRVAFPTFTCPMEGPFLSVNSSRFLVTGLQIVNCTYFSSKAAVIIESNSKAVFNGTLFKDNKRTALHIFQEADVTIMETNFDGNEAEKNGGALHICDNSHIEIANSTFKGNKAMNGNGGAIYVKDNVNLELRHSTFSYNTAQKGGSMYLHVASVATVISSVFSYNSAKLGAGMHAYTKNLLNINETTFSKNSARRDGGGIKIHKSNSLTIGGSTFSNNTAHRDGGGIDALENNLFNITSSTFSYNHVRRNGGGIEIYINNTLNVTGCAFLNNDARNDGGGTYAYINNSLSMSACTLSKNFALRDGGGIKGNTRNLLTIIGTIVSNNTAQRNGGGVYAYTNNLLKTSGSTFPNNNAHKNGGGIEVYEKNLLSINGCTFSNNTSEYGGGTYAYNYNSLIINGATVSGNSAQRNGGGICAYMNNSLAITKINVSSNGAQKHGGGMYIYVNSSLVIGESTFSSNSADQDGGGIYAYANNSLTITRSTISNNNAKYGGGTFVEAHNVLTLKEFTSSNNSVNGNGGAIYVARDNNCSMENAILSQNEASQKGGALCFYFNNSIAVVNSILEDNKAKHGAALYMELHMDAIVSRSSFSSNNATQYGTIYVGVDCIVSLASSNMIGNRATYGGCLHGYRSTLHVSYSTFVDNFSHKLGGCFYLKSSEANFQDTLMYLNNATEDGGGIYGTATDLHIRHSSIMFNNAKNLGGGMALSFDSLFHCYECKFGSNTAKRGGGCYIESNVQQNVVIQTRDSVFEGNNASEYGGGMVVKVFGLKTKNCSDLNEACSRALLLNTSFSNNFARQSGAALVATKLGGVFVSCAKTSEVYDRDFMSLETLEYWIREHAIRKLNSTKPCPSWHGNNLSSRTLEHVIGTFGRTLNIKIDSSDILQLNENVKSRLPLLNVLSGQVLPKIVVTTLDSFGNAHAPTLHEKDAILLKAEGFLQQPMSFSFVNGTCTIAGIVGFVQPGKYTIRVLPRSDDMLEAENLTLVVRNCSINEEPTFGGTLCKRCGEASYNLNSSGGGRCASCPKGADCCETYIVPTNGYWHKSPCHDKVKKCIVEEACNYPNRTQHLTDLTRNFTNCNFTNATLHDYEEAQCSEGYEGCLCGSCKKSYGLSANLGCLKCEAAWLSVLRLLLVTFCLFITTSIAIKGTLPVASRRLIRTFTMLPMLEDGNFIALEEGIGGRVEEIPQEGNCAPQVTTSDEQLISSVISTQLRHSITIAHGNMVETWKILLNFLQVNSTAATMDVKWTSTILEFFQTLNLIGSATLNAISRPIDCIVASFSIGARAMWRYLLSLFVPMIVIVILSIHWGYRSAVNHRADKWYFWRRLLLTMITTTYVAYFDITQVAVRVFNCVVVYDNTDPLSGLFTRYWIVDTSIECYESTHVALVTISLVVLIVICVGFPFVCSRALLRNRAEVNVSNSRAHEILGILCGPFKERFVYWECITMIKKAVLSIIIVFSYSLGNQAQGLLISVVLVFFLTLHSTCYPFKREFNILNYYEIGSLMTSCITYTLVEFFNINTLSEIERSLISVALVVLNGGFVIFMTLNIARNFVAFAKASLKFYCIVGIDDEIGWFKTFKIYFSSWWFGRLSSTRS